MEDMGLNRVSVWGQSPAFSRGAPKSVYVTVSTGEMPR